MKKILLCFLLLNLISDYCFSQVNFSEETKKYIEYNSPITVFKNALVIDGLGNSSKPNQTVIIQNGIIEWVGDNKKVEIPKTLT